MEDKSDQLQLLKELLRLFSLSAGLKVNYSKSMMVPINMEDNSIANLAQDFGCLVGSLPFTYLGLPLGPTKPKVVDFPASNKKM